jgi:transketolase
MNRERPSWNVTTSLPGLSAFIAGEELAAMVDAGHDIVALTADLATSNRMTDFAERYPARFFNLGIAEQNMMSVAAGLATCGYIPFVSTFAAFASLLCAEHLRTDLAYTKLRVRILAHHAGVALGFYGTSHHAIEDIAVTRAIPGLVVVAPCDAESTRAVLRSTITESGPVYVRLGRGREKPVYPKPPRLEPGRFLTLRPGMDATVIATGIGVQAALEASQLLSAHSVDLRVLDAIYLKPFDEEATCQAAVETGRILTVEEHNIIGGLGTAVASSLADHGLSPRLEHLAIPDEYAPIAPPTHLYRHYGLTGEGIAERVLSLI